MLQLEASVFSRERHWMCFNIPQPTVCLNVQQTVAKTSERVKWKHISSVKRLALNANPPPPQKKNIIQSWWIFCCSSIRADLFRRCNHFLYIYLRLRLSLCRGCFCLERKVSRKVSPTASENILDENLTRIPATQLCCYECHNLWLAWHSDFDYISSP